MTVASILKESMFVNRNNPKREVLIHAFNELVRTDLYELGI